MRLLTKRFTSYNIDKFEQRFKKDFMDFMDVGNLSINKIKLLVQMGNNNCSDEDACNIMDNYLSDENNSLIDLYMQVLEELNADTHILKGTGITVAKLREDLYAGMKMSADNAVIDDTVENTENDIQVNVENKIEPFPVNNDTKPEIQTPKVDINGFVPVN